MRHLNEGRLYVHLLIKQQSFLALACVLIIALVISMSCYGSPAVPSTPFFPVEKENDPSYIYPLALSEGKLVLDHNTLRLKHLWCTSDLLIWPYGYSLRIENKQIQVINQAGKIVAYVNGHIKVGGGEVPAEIIEKYIGQKLPDYCEGPFWLVSEVLDDK